MAPSMLPLLVIATSLVPAVVVMALPEGRARTREALTLFGAVSKVALVAALLVGVARGEVYEASWQVLPDLEMVLRVEELPLLFLTLSAALWLTTTVYALGYLDGDRRLSRFFGFFNLCVTATMGIGLAGNLFTFLIFYELLTVSTYPLVVHEGDRKALAGGRSYLAYAVTGGSVLFPAMVALHVLVGPVDFASGGVLAEAAAQNPIALTGVFVLLVVGLGVKAALVPGHGWLPRAMVAPTPVSALLHAVAVVKAGAYGIVRVVLDLYGPDTAAELGLLPPLAALAAGTLVFGSVMAIRQDGLKPRLAYSTVAQLSFVTLGVSLASPVAVVGGLVHLVHQGLMKVTLFYCAGAVATELGVHRVSELAGAGRRMPLTMGAFTLAGLAMVGVPPLAGFVTKWHLGVGGVLAGQWWVPALMLLSSLLTAAYVLPIVHAAWFRQPADPWPTRDGRREVRPSLLWPALVTATAVVAVGVLADAPFSPLSWSQLIAQEAFAEGAP